MSMQQTEITLLRHVKVAGEAGLYGRTDVAPMADHNDQVFNALSSVSNGQKPLAQRFDIIVTSPLQRCRLLAQRLSEGSDLPCVVLPGFQEMNFGDYDGCVFSRVHQTPDTEQINWPTLERFWQDPANHTLPNAESLLAFHQRIEHSWQALLRQYQGKKVLLVTHGGVIRMVLSLVLPLDWKSPQLYQTLRIGNGSLTKISCYHYFANIDEHSGHNEVEFVGLTLNL